MVWVLGEITLVVMAVLVVVGIGLVLQNLLLVAAVVLVIMTQLEMVALAEEEVGHLTQTQMALVLLDIGMEPMLVVLMAVMAVLILVEAVEVFVIGIMMAVLVAQGL
jgi:hypothetical protein